MKDSRASSAIGWSKFRSSLASSIPISLDKGRTRGVNGRVEEGSRDDTGSEEADNKCGEIQMNNLFKYSDITT